MVIPPPSSSPRPHRPQQTGGEARDQGLDMLFVAAYEELRRLAAMIQRDDPSATISPTALVNEAWLKLAASPGLAPASALHFRRIAGRAMRQVLIEAARGFAATQGPEHQNTAIVRIRLGRALLGQGRAADAFGEVRAGHDLLVPQVSPDAPWLRHARTTRN